MKTIKLENETDFVRDPSSKALLNTNVKALNASKRKIERDKQINTDIKNIKNELDEMKTLQREILELVKKYQKDN